jgi:hypothetical protein
MDVKRDRQLQISFASLSGPKIVDEFENKYKIISVLLEETLENHRAQFGKYPDVVTADGGFHPAKEQMDAIREKVGNVAVGRGSWLARGDEELGGGSALPLFFPEVDGQDGESRKELPELLFVHEVVGGLFGSVRPEGVVFDHLEVGIVLRDPSGAGAEGCEDTSRRAEGAEDFGDGLLEPGADVMLEDAEREDGIEVAIRKRNHGHVRIHEWGGEACALELASGGAEGAGRIVGGDDLKAAPGEKEGVSADAAAHIVDASGVRFGERVDPVEGDLERRAIGPA